MNNLFVVGKYTLESLTNGMYSSPLDLYREYIQNSVDSIDDAVKCNLINKKDSRIDIKVDTKKSTITIRDNGQGISKESAYKLLVDIGNSKKSRSLCRGFRGIGRLAGLGYCESLKFSTSAQGETEKSIITFNAKKLKELLIPGNNDESIYDVINAVVDCSYLNEKKAVHYFEVTLEGVSLKKELMEYSTIVNYLIQNAPVPFHPSFYWGQTIKSKMLMSNYEIPEYNIFLQYDDQIVQLFKPYRDIIISDRIKKLEDNIHDIKVKLIGDENNPLGIMWYASTNFYGTIIDNCIKGIRLRQGNILIGNSTTCSQYFKEERFNGWVIGEIYITNNGLIANARRDNFEQNAPYFQLTESIKHYATSITKELRKLSNDRSLNNMKKSVADVELEEDINELCIEDMNFTCDVDEYTLMNQGDSIFEAEYDFADKLSLILDNKNKQTKYTAININEKLTMEQRHVLERVFDLISQEYTEDESKKFIDIITNKF